MKPTTRFRWKLPLTDAERAELREINRRLERLRVIAASLLSRRRFLKCDAAAARNARRRARHLAQLPQLPSGVWRWGRNYL